MYVETLLALLGSKNNRLVWGGMIALSTSAQLKAAEIFTQVEALFKAVNTGSVITADYGIRTLARVAATDQKYNEVIFPFLLEHLRTCRSRDIPQRAEVIATAVTKNNQAPFLDILNRRKAELTPTQIKRVEKVLQRLSHQVDGIP